jgi:CheY-like chemotaxis protein
MILPAQVPQPRGSSNARTILVAEDEVLVRAMVSEYLRDHGYEVVEAADAAEALAVFDAGVQVDIVFSDVQMPGSMDGAMLADVVRLRYRIPVLLTTGDHMRAAALSLADTVMLLPKPYALDDVVRHVEALLTFGGRTRREGRS